MNGLFLYTLLLCILNSILFFEFDLGINVILFNIPLLILLVYNLKRNNLIKNKYGLLLIIPILILSSNYFIYDNDLKYYNILIIPILIMLMNIITTNTIYSILDYIKEGFNMIFLPISKIKNVINLLKNRTKIKPKDKTKKIFISIIVTLPIIVFILYLLGKSDPIFNEIFLNLEKIYLFIDKYLKLDKIIDRLIIITLLFFYISCTLNYISFNKKIIEEKELKENNTYIFNILFTVLNIIYILFDIIQIRSLFLHKVPNGFVYSEYAREGFFQLLLVSTINIILVMISKKYKENNYIKNNTVITMLLNIIIVSSSIVRFVFYIQQYGLTFDRIFALSIIIIVLLMIIPVIYYIYKKFNITNVFIIITVTIYTLLNIVNINKIIFNYNVKLGEYNHNLDLYQITGNYDTMEEQIELYKNIKNNKYSIDNIDISSRNYINRNYILDDYKDYYNDIKNNSLFEFNISKNKSKKLLKNFLKEK